MRMISSLDIRSACARVLDAEQKWVGSSFLVSSRHALTAAHVVERLNTGPIVLEFSVGRYNAKVEVLDKGIDCAVLSLDRAVDDVQPLGLGVNVTAGDTGRFFGFSQNLGGAGILIDGRVQDIILNPLWSVGEKAPRPTILLFPSHHLSKRTVIGFSGAPLVVGNLAVGILRELREGETGSTEFLLFTRIQDALELLPKEVAGRILPRPPTEQSRERRGKDAIVVVTALDEELDYLYEESSLHWSDLKVNQDGLSYRQGHLGDADIIAASARSMGSIATAILTTKALKERQPTVAAMIGISAGRKE